MPEFRELYDFCQTLEPKVKRNVIVAKVQELTGIGEITVIKQALDVAKIRGFFISASNSDAQFVRQTGKNVIVLARDQNECWDRFVTIKELMHLFDTPEQTTSTGDQLAHLLTEFEVAKPQPSSQYVSEVKSVWMALACLCPEPHRVSFAEQIAKGHESTYGVALKLKIPERHVRNLVSPAFGNIMTAILQVVPE
jgi:hypothetical protein